MSKLPIYAAEVDKVITLTADSRTRRIYPDRNFIITSKTMNPEEREVQLHLTDNELHELYLDIEKYMTNKPEITTIRSYKRIGGKNGT